MKVEDEKYKKKFNPEYKFYKTVFRIGVAFLLILFATMIYIEGGITKKGYVKCSEHATGGMCFNPLYEEGCERDYCSKQILVAGESIGSKPSVLSENYGLITFLTIMLCFLINHTVNVKNGKTIFQE